MKSFICQSLVKLILLLLCVSLADNASAACYSGHPDVGSERHDSVFVILGKVISTHDAMSKDDPGIVGETAYEVAVLRSYKGTPGRKMKITSVNTSTRFPMDIGKTYLLFVMDDDRSYFVDACGNSGLAAERRSVADQL